MISLDIIYLNGISLCIFIQVLLQLLATMVLYGEKCPSQFATSNGEREDPAINNDDDNYIVQIIFKSLSGFAMDAIDYRHNNGRNRPSRDIWIQVSKVIVSVCITIISVLITIISVLITIVSEYT
jgi:hypothetical protein